MANPVINGVEQDLRRGRVAQRGYVPPQQGQFTQQDQYAQAGQAAQGSPAQTSARPITYEDVINKSGIMLGLLFVAAAAVWVIGSYIPAVAALGASLGALGAFVVSMVCIFKRKITPALFVTYSVLEGAALGGISMVFEQRFPGVVVQAVVATAAIFAVTLILFKSGYVRGSSKLMKFALISLVGILIYSIASWLLTAFGVITNPMGADSITLFGIPLGVLVGIFAVVVGAICLILDFEVARQAVETGAASELSWRVAFGIVLDTVYIYVYLLRLLAVARDN